MTHPYEDIADDRRWDRGVAALDPADVDPAEGFPTLLDRSSRIVSAGSCFGQHVAHHLRAARFDYLVTEPGHPLLGGDLRRKFNYGVYSARYGNVYTSRQLLQLLERAYGRLEPKDAAWQGEHGLVDPFRPTSQPRGFRTREELEADREQHLAAVRRAFEELDVFIFTLGLTECWAACADGAVFPVAPGVAGGEYAAERYELLRLGVSDVVADLTAFVSSLRAVNAGATVILTVSPVALFATALDRHVLVSNAASKAVLRAAADELAGSVPGVHYFPAYEIVAANPAYLAADRRTVTPEGVDRVMSLFLQHAAASSAALPEEEREVGPADFDDAMSELVEVLCDEELSGPSGLRTATPGGRRA